ncbi:LamG domain-containing protein [Candidatus Nanosalina sp. VS9-1]|uniref:LamG domain-containing protein n=1 Tax=Candidatus Nanosalina sp. VS9-1 TaxID=3388566 RepID=UPI0039E14C4B
MTGLVGWWPLNEDSGSTAYDLSGNNNHGTLNGGVTKGVAGKGGLTGYGFDKSSGDNVSFPDSPVLDLSTVSVFAWIRPRNPTSNGVDGVVVKGGSSTRNYQLDIDSSQGLAWYDENGGSLHSGVMPEQGKWTHVGATFQNGTLKLYVDGELVATEEGRPSLPSSSESGAVGTDNHGNFFDGDISDIRIYNRSLQASEIQALYDWGSGDYARPLNNQNSSSAVSRWSFNSSGADDVWGSNSGTVSGATYLSDGGPRENGAYSFDGSSSKITLPDGTFSIADGGNDFSLSLWYYPESTGKQILVSLRGDWNWQLQYDALGNSKIRFINYDGSSNRTVETSRAIETGHWYHVTAAYSSSGTGRIYVNGVDEASGSLWTNPQQTSNGNFIGVFDDYKEYLNGVIDDLRLYSKFIQPSEVSQLYRYGTGGRDMRKFTVNSR